MHAVGPPGGGPRLLVPYVGYVLRWCSWSRRCRPLPQRHPRHDGPRPAAHPGRRGPHDRPGPAADPALRLRKGTSAPSTSATCPCSSSRCGMSLAASTCGGTSAPCTRDSGRWTRLGPRSSTGCRSCVRTGSSRPTTSSCTARWRSVGRWTAGPSTISSPRASASTLAARRYGRRPWWPPGARAAGDGWRSWPTSCCQRLDRAPATAS